MKLYFILSVFVFMAAISGASVNSKEFVGSNFSGLYADTTLKCPVTGDDIPSEPVMFRYIDKDVKFCNEGCVLAFKKEPAKFTEHLLCMPCNDPDGKKDINAVHKGVKYYFCSGGCREKFTAKPDEYLKEFKEDK